ncbi:MAG: hypothetical protein JWR61_3644 [Ferruginibacter sp.]|nr:hypothetical protein [Ferruginibacter sp.]
MLAGFGERLKKDDFKHNTRLSFQQQKNAP